MKIKKQRILSSILSLMLGTSCLSPMAAFAEEAQTLPAEDGSLRYWFEDLEKDKLSSLEITYVYDADDENIALQGAEFSIVKIADLKVKNGNAVYTPIENVEWINFEGAKKEDVDAYAERLAKRVLSKNSMDISGNLVDMTYDESKDIYSIEHPDMSLKVKTATVPPRTDSSSEADSSSKVEEDASSEEEDSSIASDDASVETEDTNEETKEEVEETTDESASSEDASSEDSSNTDSNVDSKTDSKAEDSKADETEPEVPAEWYTILDKKVTDDKGVCKFENLEPGLYLVLQTDRSGVSRTYYKCKPFIINAPFPVVDTDEFDKVGNPIGKWNYEVTAEPKSEAVREMPAWLDIQIGKVEWDNIKYYLKGAEITLYTSDGAVAKDQNGNDCVGVSDENGHVSFTVVYDPEISYYAKETKAPAGYEINENKFDIVAVYGENGEPIPDTLTIPIEIRDKKIIVPPSTGDLLDNKYVYIAVGSISAAIILIIFAVKKIKKNDD